jgi:DedD protein
MQWNTESEFKVVNQGNDKEVTLGPLMLTVLGVGLFGLCCICFLAGYAVGRRSTPSNPSSTTGSSSGRSAADILAQAAQAVHPSAAGSPAPATRTQPAEPTATLSRTAAAQEPAPPPPVAKLPAPQPPAPQPATAQPAAVHAALPQFTSQADSWVVQVAAVENSTDADVLVSALRRRGYSVSAHHNAGDNLIHVQVGPFATHTDADSMRQRLLNDGYNANIEP